MLPQFNSADCILYSATNRMSQIPHSSRENGNVTCCSTACNIVLAQYIPADAAAHVSRSHIQHPGPVLPLHAGLSKARDLPGKFLTLSRDLFSGKLNLIFKYWLSLNHFKLYLNNSQSPL